MSIFIEHDDLLFNVDQIVSAHFIKGNNSHVWLEIWFAHRTESPLTLTDDSARKVWNQLMRLDSTIRVT